MTAHAVARARRGDIPRPEMHRAGKVAVASLVLLGVGALAGGLALVAKPDGSVMGFDTGLLAGSPFSDFLVPGLILGGLFGIGSLAVAALGLRHAYLAPFGAFAIGIGQMVWIVVELAIIKEFSFLHPTMFGIGLLIAVAAYLWGRPTFFAWLRTLRAV
jgi:hypothetical protein